MSDQHQDPFADPFSSEPAPPTPSFGAPASPDLPPPPPMPTAPPAPPARAVQGLSPASVFFGSYVFAGIAALLLATAIALLVAISDFRSGHGGTSGSVLVAAATGFVVVAALVVSLGVLDDRGRSWARTATWVVCGLGLCAAAAVFVLDPGESVAWFAQLLHVGAVVTIIVSVASAVLLALPESNEYFRTASRPEPVAVSAFSQFAASTQPPAPVQQPAPARSQPSRPVQPPGAAHPPASSAPPPGPPANDADYDPFS
jgi:hypothetical protein